MSMGTPGTSGMCVNGHPYAGDNLAHHKDGSRKCLLCQEGQRERHRRARNTGKRPAPKCYTCPDTSYQTKAACRTYPDPRDFDPLTNSEVTQLGGDARSHPRLVRAIAFCEGSGCPVREQCLAWALASHQQGVWGGQYLSREKLRKKGIAA